ncbi:uncharacterized protein METZ01_LOCUS437300, partial [marine metagenome]
MRGFETGEGWGRCMTERNMRLGRRFQLDRPTIGTWLTLNDPAVAELMAAAGFDWLVVDLEHSLLTLERAGELIRVIELCGSTPLVRLTSIDLDQIKRVMDAGAHGVVVPMVLCADDAERAVAGTRYPPAGTRGVGLGRAHGYGVGFQEYWDWQVDEPIVIVQIEHRLALDNLDEIFAVPGVDGLLIGPYDLSASMGIPGKFDDPLYTNSLELILST